MANEAPTSVAPKSLAWKIQASLLVLAAAVYVLSQYTGVFHGMYMGVWQYLADKGSFPNDIYFRNSALVATSSLCRLAELTGVDFLDNDLAGLALYLAFCGLSLWSADRLLAQFLGVADFRIRWIVILLATMWGEGKFLEYTQQTGFIFPHVGTPSFFAFHLAFPFFLLLLHDRLLLAALLLTLIWSLAFKVGWMLLPIALGYLALDGRWRRPAVLSFLLPVGFILFRRATVPMVGDTRELIRMAMEVGRAEDLIHYNQGLNLLLYALALPLGWLLAGQIPTPRGRSFLRGIFASSACVFVFGYFYGRFGYELLPINGITALGLIRALSYSTLFLSVCLGLFLLTSERLLPVERLLAFTAFCFWNVDLVVSDQTRYFKLAALPLLAWLALPGTLKDKALARLSWLTAERCLILLTAFACLSAAHYARGAAIQITRNIEARKILFAETGKWTFYSEFRPENLSLLLALRKSPEDFPLLALQRNAEGRYEYDLRGESNLVALKTRFTAGAGHFLFNRDLYAEHLKRTRLVDELVSTLNRGTPVDAGTLAGLRERKVRILVPAEALPLLGRAPARIAAGPVMVEP